jgi:hypothetical protein
VNGDDLKRMQDHFLDISKRILLEEGCLRPVGFVITLHKHVEKLFESGWGIEFIDPKALIRDVQDDSITALIIDLAMDWKKLYHAALNVFPQSPQVQRMLPQMIALGKSTGVDDAYMRVMRAFLKATELDEKDIVSATMRQICDKTNAFACVYHAEAWYRVVEATETVEGIRKLAPKSLGQDRKSVEVLVSSMETYDFKRMITVPIQRAPSSDPNDRDAGKVLGFGAAAENVDDAASAQVLEGRMAHFLKPLPVAS